MLGRNAGGLYWMFRYLERSENTARLVEAGLRFALTRSADAEDEWASIVDTAGNRESYLERYDRFDAAGVIDFLLRDRSNPSSVMSIVNAARTNARMVRTSLTREVWEATNECWMELSEALRRPVRAREMPAVLATIRERSALVRGALHGTMLRNDIFDFARLGTFLERADSTARILDVKYYVLLPTLRHVGSSLDNVQWETILRSVSAHRAFYWLHGADVSPITIADFLIHDRRLPRSLAFCYTKVLDNLGYLADDYGMRTASHTVADHIRTTLTEQPIEAIFDSGLHEFLTTFIRDNNVLGAQIERDYRFSE